MAVKKQATKAAAAKDKAFHNNKRPLSRKPGESGDPDVQFLLAKREGLQQNRDLLDPPKAPRDAALKTIDRQLADIDKELANLGYKVK